MPITQISVPLENEPGRLHTLCELLEKEEINIKAVMASSRQTPMQVHMIVDDPPKAASVLKSNGFEVSTKEVLAVATPDHPGGLNAVLRSLLESKINIETLYPFIGVHGDEAIIILEVDNIQETKRLLKKHWVKTFSNEIYKM
jgi:hypothetical protein